MDVYVCVVFVVVVPALRECCIVNLLRFVVSFLLPGASTCSFVTLMILPYLCDDRINLAITYIVAVRFPGCYFDL